MKVIATTRSAERAGELQQLGVAVHVSPTLSRESVAEIVSVGAGVLVAFAPDGQTDAQIAPALTDAERVVYISTTGVYGSATGRVDESTPVDATEPRAAAPTRCGKRVPRSRCHRAARGRNLRSWVAGCTAESWTANFTFPGPARTSSRAFMWPISRRSCSA